MSTDSTLPTTQPVRADRPYKRGECKADIAVQRHELMRENIALKNELAAAKNDNDALRHQLATAETDVACFGAETGRLREQVRDLTTRLEAAQRTFAEWSERMTVVLRDKEREVATLRESKARRPWYLRWM